MSQNTQDKGLILIIGAGLAGLSVAYHLEQNAYDQYLILEAESYVGGKARSEEKDGFTFDVTGHWLHLRDQRIKEMISKVLPSDHFQTIQRISRIWSHGVYTEYPFQGNLYGLPPHVIKECLLGAIEAHTRQKLKDPSEQTQEPLNFEDFIKHYFGQGIADHFMLPYNSKLWGVQASEITSLWCQRFVPKPNLADIVAGAVGCHQNKMGYNASFIYPKKGGIQSVADAIATHIPSDKIKRRHQVTQIDPIQKKVTYTFEGQSFEQSYHTLINTNAMTKLIDQIPTAPTEIKTAKSKLRANEVIYLNVALEGKLKQPDHWIYIPELKWPVYRIGSFSNAMPSMVPEGCSNLYVELSDRTTPVDELMPIIRKLLLEMDLIDADQKIRYIQERRIQNAYVIYDFHYVENRQVLHQWLNEQEIFSIGRYGDWNYSSMEDALIDGLNLVERLLS